MLKIKLKDNSELEVEEGLSVIEIAKKISEGLARVANMCRNRWRSCRLKNNSRKDCSLNILHLKAA